VINEEASRHVGTGGLLGRGRCAIVPSAVPAYGFRAGMQGGPTRASSSGTRDPTSPALLDCAGRTPNLLLSEKRYAPPPPPPRGSAPSRIEVAPKDPVRTTAPSAGQRRLRLASAVSVSVFALGIAFLGGCDPDSTSRLIAPVELPVLTGDTVPCPHQSWSGCRLIEFSEGNPWRDELQNWYQSIEGPTSACTKAFEEMEDILNGLTGTAIYTFSGHSGGGGVVGGIVFSGTPQVNHAVGLRSGTGYAVAADGSVLDATLAAETLAHEGYHAIGAHGIDTEDPPNGPGMISACQNYDPPV